jgi:pimeloyl-ACP methyl ester carboxylesterase
MRYFKAAPSEKDRYESYLKPAGNGFVLKRDPFFSEQFRRTLATGERPKPGVDLWQLLAEVKCPILSVRGARSDLYAAETVEKMKAANARLGVCEVDAGHDIAGENPHALRVALQSFLERLEESHERTT